MWWQKRRGKHWWNDITFDGCDDSPTHLVQGSSGILALCEEHYQKVRAGWKKIDVIIEL